MKGYLRQSLFPPGFKEDKMNEFLELSQQGRSIEEYYQAFARLLKFSTGFDEVG